MTPRPDPHEEARLLYFAPVHWRSYDQRPHAFVRRFLADCGGKALWVDPYLTRLPRAGDLKAAPSLLDQRTRIPPGLEVARVLALPVEPVPGGASLNRLVFWGSLRARFASFAREGRLVIGVGKPSRLAVRALAELDPAASFYDAMDRFPAFYGGLSRRAAARSEEEILRRVDEVFASSTFLERCMSARHPRVRKVLNAFDTEGIAPLPRSQRPADVFGYVGTMASWFDWELMRETAEALPRAQFVLAGPIFHRPSRPLPKNIRLAPPCSSEEAAALIGTFTAGLIPFCRTPLTEAVDPIKYYAYRAAGLPVLSTAFGEMCLRGPGEGVFHLERGKDPAAAVERALAWQDPDVAEFRSKNSWEHRLREAGVFEKRVRTGA